MTASGLNPNEEFETPEIVSKERLAEFDRLHAQGGMEAIVEKLFLESLNAVIS